MLLYRHAEVVIGYGSGIEKSMQRSRNRATPPIPQTFGEAHDSLMGCPILRYDWFLNFDNNVFDSLKVFNKYKFFYNLERQSMEKKSSIRGEFQIPMVGQHLSF